MAGSLSHITDENGQFTFDRVDNMGDAWETCEECFNDIKKLEAEKKAISDDLDHERSMKQFLTNEISQWIERCMKAENKLEELNNGKEK